VSNARLSIQLKLRGGRVIGVIDGGKQLEVSWWLLWG